MEKSKLVDFSLGFHWDRCEAPPALGLPGGRSACEAISCVKRLRGPHETVPKASIIIPGTSYQEEALHLVEEKFRNPVLRISYS